MSNMENKVDAIVEAAKGMLDERSARGILKYGTTLEENVGDSYLQHGLEEALDLINYLLAHKHQMKKLCDNHPNDMELGEKVRRLFG